MAETTMPTPRGPITVERPHTSRSSPLRAWSAADRLVLDHLGTASPGRLLIVNDEFGALTCALADEDLTVWSDSALSKNATTANLAANRRPPLAPERMIAGHERPTGRFDTVVVGVPKSLALLEYQLAVIGSVCAPDTTVVGAGMVRHVHSSTVAAFEALGPTTTSRATRKARLLFCDPEPSEDPVELPHAEFTTSDGTVVVEYPGTFSAGHLDVGSALLLEVLATRPPPEAGSVVVDLGCGNGVLVTSLVRTWAEQGIDRLEAIAVDASDLAVAATLATWQRNDMPDALRAFAADGVEPLEDASVDVVVTNPPFHQGHAMDRDLTDHLLADAARVLRPGGVAYVVVQRHLQLHTRMRRWFASVEVASKHPSHVVLIARR